MRLPFLASLPAMAAMAAMAAVAACASPAGPVAHSPAVHPLLKELNAGTKAGPVVVAPATASKVTFQRMAKYPEPGNNVPRNAQWSPDGKTLTFLASESGDETMALFAFDVATGTSKVLLRAADLGATGTRSREEELRRERQRDRNEGITAYSWAAHAPVLVLPYAGDIYVKRVDRDEPVRRLTKTEAPEIDPKICDTGERIAFVRDGELVAIDVASGKETALSTRSEGLTHGVSDYVGQEELGEPSGFFWSPKCDRVAYLEVDERPVDKVPVLGFRGGADLMIQRYPRAGTKNPLVRAGVVDLASRKTTWLGPADPARYLGRFTWAEDGTSLYFQSLARDQKHVEVLRAGAKEGWKPVRAGIEESSPAWVTFDAMKLVPQGIVHTQMRDGHRHLDVQGAAGAVLPLTSGAWDVESIVAVDATRVLFTATKDGPLERHLYSVALDGKQAQPTRLTTEHGVHGIRADEHGGAWLDVHSGEGRPPQAVVMRDGKEVGKLPMPVDPEITSLGLRTAEHVTITAADGAVLQAAVLKPRNITGKHPAIVMVYGGPESQLVWDSWQPRLSWQHLADRGFVVFQVDNRGTAGRGRADAQKVHKQLGKLELEDQIAGAKWLASQPYVDGTRIGIYGHSYGGYMAALAMLDGKGTFKVGIAGSPVTDWRLYDTGYTERYMETPESNPAGYEASDLTKKAAGLQGKLLVMHAMMDENVHYAHTAKLIDALVAADKKFDLLVLPGERHGLRAPAARAYVPEKVADYFAENL